MNTTPGDALFLRILVTFMNAKRGAEIGSANGYGSIHMGMAFELTGGHLYTMAISGDMVEECRENLRKVGLEKSVTCLEGDALDVIPTLDGEFDFVFIDAAKRDYFKYFKLLEPKLKRRAAIVADNVIIHAEEMREFIQTVENDPAYDMVVIRASEEKGDGMVVILKKE